MMPMFCKKTATALALLLALAGSARAQSADSLFSLGRHYAYQQQYDSAEWALGRALALAPDYEDVQLFMARVLGWQHRYDEAEAILAPIGQRRKPPAEYYHIRCDFYQWQQQQDSLLLAAREAVAKGHSRLHFGKRVGDALMAKGDYEAAAEHWFDLQLRYPNDAHIARQAARTNLYRSNDALWLRYHYDYVTIVYDDWRDVLLGYQWGGKNLSISAQVDFAERFGISDQQLALEAYPVFADRSYLYAHVSTASGKVFPRWRGDVSYFRHLGRFEAEAGLRYWYFSPESTVLIATAALSSFFGKAWVHYRYGWVQADTRNVVHSLTARRYYGSKGSFLHAEATFGNDSRALQQNGLDTGFRRNNKRFAGGITHRFDQEWQLEGLFGFEIFDFGPDVRRNQFSGQLGVKYWF